MMVINIFRADDSPAKVLWYAPLKNIHLTYQIFGNSRGIFGSRAKYFWETHLKCWELTRKCWEFSQKCWESRPKCWGLRKKYWELARLICLKMFSTGSMLSARVPNRLMLENLLVDICRLRAMSLNELANLLDRNKTALQQQYLNPLVASGRLQYAIPDMINHPKQAYRAEGE